MTRFLALILIGAAAALAMAKPARTEKFYHVDLQPKATQKLSDNAGSGREGNDLISVPKGQQSLEGVSFKIAEGKLQLGSKLLKEEMPDKIEGVKVGEKCRKIHILHATGYGNGSAIGEEGKEGDPLFIADGTRIAEYRLHFEDGDTEVLPVVYGDDVRDWWFVEGAKGVKRGKVAWSGDNELAKSFGCKIRLYMNTWDNPAPKKALTSIDYVKVNDTPAAPFCLAITLEE
jgi:hypothetical protein